MASTIYTPWAVTAGEQPTTAYWNILGSNDSSFNTGQGFNDGIIVNRHLAAGAVLSANVKPTYIESTGNTNGTGSRSVSSSNYLVPGSIITYTTGSTNEILHCWGYGLVQGASGGCGLLIQVNGAGIGRRTYTELINYNSHYPTGLFSASPNTTYTIRLFVYAGGSTTICDSNTDPSSGFQAGLTLLAWGRT